MKKNLRHFWLLLAGMLLTLTSQQAHATHAIGGDMSYVSVSPGFYLVTYRFYRDCSGTPAVPANFILSYEATGCGTTNAANAGGTITLQQRGLVQGNPYCTRQNAQSPCDPNGPVMSNLPNYQICTYSGLLNLSAGPTFECTDWVLGVTEQSRPGTANLNGQDGMYTEVHFNNKLVPDDSSPAFPSDPGFQPLIFTCDTTYRLITSQVVDPDNFMAGNQDKDSLAYKSVRPLGGPGAPIAYAPTYSLANPVRTWNGRRLSTGPNVPFSIDPISGIIQFSSGLTITSPNDEDNKFAISIAVESWRRINGVGPRRKISTVRRDILIVIFKCLSRPNPPQLNNNGDSSVVNVGVDTVVTINATDTITVDACANAIIRLSVNDINGDSIRPYIVGNQLPGQATITVNQQQIVPGVITTAVIQLTWIPDVNTIGGYYPVTVRLIDNGCPIRGERDQPLVLHVVKRQYADVGLANQAATDTLCVGQTTTLKATTVRPAVNGITGQPARYKYVWDQDANNSILSIDTVTHTATVKPRVTTRYLVHVYSPQGCEDTSSVVVVVDPTNRATVMPADTLCPGQETMIRVNPRTRLIGPDGMTIVYTYKWVDSAAIRSQLPTTLSNDSIPNPIAKPRVTTRYYATVYSSLGCTDTASVVVRVDPTNIGSAKATPDTVCIGQPALLEAISRTRTVGPDGTPIVYTYQWVGADSIATTTLTNATAKIATAKPRVTTRYFATIYSSLGCTDTTSILVRVDPTNIASVTSNVPVDSVVCRRGFAELTVHPRLDSIAPDSSRIIYTYDWTGDTTLSDTASRTPVARPYQTTRYYVTVYSSLGCTDTASVVVNVDPVNIARATTVAVAPDSVLCPGTSAGLLAIARATSVDANGDPIVYSYRWRADSTLSDLNISNPIATPPAGSTRRYYVSVFSSAGCTDTASVVLKTDVLPATPQITDPTSDAFPDVVLAQGQTQATLNVKAANDLNNDFTYLFEPADNLSDPHSSAPVITNPSGKVTYEITITNANGCSIERTLTVIAPIDVPNIITPGVADGKNDKLVISSPEKIELKIFNRWGREVYSKKEYDNSWNAEDLPAGTYYYLVTGAQTRKLIKGWVEVVK